MFYLHVNQTNKLVKSIQLVWYLLMINTRASEIALSSVLRAIYIPLIFAFFERWLSLTHLF